MEMDISLFQRTATESPQEWLDRLQKTDPKTLILDEKISLIRFINLAKNLSDFEARQKNKGSS